MTRSELIEALCRRMPHLSYKMIEDVVKSIFEQMVSSLGNGGRVEIRGFGSFSLRYRPARVARNPKTGEKVRTLSKYSPHFKPGKEMRDRVNESAANGKPIKGD